MCAIYGFFLNAFLIPLHSFFGSIGLLILQAPIEAFDSFMGNVFGCM